MMPGHMKVSSSPPKQEILESILVHRLTRSVITDWHVPRRETSSPSLPALRASASNIAPTLNYAQNFPRYLLRPTIPPIIIIWL